MYGGGKKNKGRDGVVHHRLSGRYPGSHVPPITIVNVSFFIATQDKESRSSFPMVLLFFGHLVLCAEVKETREQILALGDSPAL